MACCTEIQNENNKVIKKGDLSGTTVQGTGALSGSGVVNATSAGTVSIGHNTKFSSTGQTSPNSAQTPSFGEAFNVPVVKYDEYGHITGSTTTTVTLPTLEAQQRTELYVGSADTSGNTASTNGNTKIKLGISGGTVWDSKIISGAGATTVTSDEDGNITIKSPLLVDPSISAETENVLNYLKSDSGACCKADPGRDLFIVGTDTFQMAPWQIYNYFAGSYNDGIRIHCPIYKNSGEIYTGSTLGAAKKQVYDAVGEDLCGRIFTPKFFENGIVLCGYDNPCAEGKSPKSWTIYNNGGHLSISRYYNHGRADECNFLRCEPSDGCNTYFWPDPAEDVYEAGLEDNERIRDLFKDKNGYDPNMPGSNTVWCPSTNNAREWLVDSSISPGSDRRLKENIQKIPTDEINKIWERCKETGFIKKFNLKNNPRKKYGVIAQEIRDIIPSTVLGKESEDSFLFADYDSVYGALIGTLIEKVKELEKKVEELEKKN